MTEFPGDTPSLGQRLARERRQLVAVLFVTRKREHLTAEPHKLDSVFIVPSDHLDNIACVCEPDFFNVALAAGDVGGLGLVGAVLGGVFGFGGVFERVAVVED